MACTEDQRSPVVARGGIRRNLLCCSLTLAGIGICTWISFRLGQGFAFTGFIYLVFVVLTAMYGGFLIGHSGLRRLRGLPELFLRAPHIQLCQQSRKLGGAWRF